MKFKNWLQQINVPMTKQMCAEMIRRTLRNDFKGTMPIVTSRPTFILKDIN